MRTNCFVISALLLFNTAFSQDTIYARRVLNEITSAEYYGRGYVKNGDHRAAHYIKQQFKNFGIQVKSEKFYFPVNKFPSKMSVSIDGKELVPGIDYIVHPCSGSASAEYNLQVIDSAQTFNALQQPTFNCMVFDMDAINTNRESADKILRSKHDGAAVFLENKKLTWGVSQHQYAIPVIILLRNNFDVKAVKIKFAIQARLQSIHVTQNIIAEIKGTSGLDSCIVFSAHYDHLGMMGNKTIFPGANDNASGISMLLNLAQFYSRPENKPEYSIRFIAFAGEEAGLLGSRYYTDLHSLDELKKIKFLINLDIVGTGNDGITVVNATEYKDQFNKLKDINEEKHYLPFIGERGKSKNSDHYYFSEKGIPAIFIYTIGGIQAYHDIYDKGETLPLTAFTGLFKLLVDFEKKL
jgi:aminopeptidase YwaD